MTGWIRFPVIDSGKTGSGADWSSAGDVVDKFAGTVDMETNLPHPIHNYSLLQTITCKTGKTRSDFPLFVTFMLPVRYIFLCAKSLKCLLFTSLALLVVSARLKLLGIQLDVYAKNMTALPASVTLPNKTPQRRS